jgi:transcriptional regulator with XRE-family HTH domain
MNDGVVVRHLLREQVAEEVRALLARKLMTGADLATAIGRSPMYVSRRVRGEVAFDIDDMQRIAEALGVPLLQLLPEAVRRGQSRDSGTASAGGDLNASSSKTIRSALDRPVRRRSTDRRADAPDVRGVSPFGHQRRDSTRPVSDIAVASRRPKRIGPGVRPMAS